MTLEVNSPIGAAFLYQDDGIPEHQIKQLQVHEEDLDLLRCTCCNKRLHPDIGFPLHIGNDGMFYCGISCELEMKEMQDIADIAEAIISSYPVHKKVAHV